MNNQNDRNKRFFVLIKSVLPRTAIIISFLLGYIIIFMPWMYISIQPIANTNDEQNTVIFIKGRDLPSVDNCVFSQVEWQSTALQMVFKMNGLFEILQLVALIYIWVHFLRKDIKKTAVLWSIFSLMSLLLLLTKLRLKPPRKERQRLFKIAS